MERGADGGDGASVTSGAPPLRALLVHGWMPLLAWLLAAALGVGVVLYFEADERSHLTGLFEVRAEATGQDLAGEIAAKQELLATRGVDLLATDEVSPGVLRTVVTGLGFDAGALFDGRGRYLTATTFDESRVGRDYTQVLEHVQVAVSEGRPGTSQLTMSPALGVPAVGLSAPFATPEGRRIVTGVLTVRDHVLESLDAVERMPEDAHVDLLDREQNLISSTHLTFPADAMTAYDAVAPTAAAASAERPRGTYVGPDGEPVVYLATDVPGTGWQAVVSIAERDLLAPLAPQRRAAWTLWGVFGLVGLAMAVAAAVNLVRRRAAEEGVRRTNAELEREVERRTAALRSAMEQARKDEQTARRHAAVVESVTEAIIGQDSDGIITSWNAAAEALYGYRAEDAVGQPIDLLVGADHSDEPAELTRRAVEEEPVLHHRTIRLDRAGEQHVVDVSVAPVRDATGVAVGVVSIHLDVTERERVRAASQRATAMFEGLFRTGPPQAVTAADGRILDVNDALCDMLGYSRAQLLGMTAAQVTHPQDQPLTRDYFAALRDGSVGSVQQRKRYIRADGEVVHGLLHLTPVAGPAGEDMMLGVVQDITELVRAQEQLAQREALLEGVTASSANISTMYDATGRCVFAAGAGLAAIGEDPDTMVGSWFVERHGGSAAMMDAFRRAMSGEQVDVVTRLRGRVFDVRFRSASVDDETRYVALAVTDVTERQRAQEAAERSERRYRALVQHAKDAILQVDVEGVLLDASPGVAGLTGLHPDDVRGRSVLDLVVPADHERIRGAMAELLRVGSVRGRCGTADGSGALHRVAYDAVDLRDDDAIGSIVLTMRDVTDEEHAEFERRRHAEQLEAVNRRLEEALAIRDHILSATTHELRTPLTPMVGLLELVRARWDELDRETLWHYFQVLDRNTGRLTSLVEDLLAATSLRSGDIDAAPVQVPVRCVAEEVLERFPVAAAVEVRGDEAVATCTPEHLEQVLHALVSNATTHGQAPYGVAISSEDTTVTVAVTDAGPGIDEADVAMLFEPFSQGSVGDQRTVSRLGLGLPIARALAEANSGRLSYRRSREGGSAFVLTLPRHREPVSPPPVAAAAGTSQ